VLMHLLVLVNAVYAQKAQGQLEALANTQVSMDTRALEVAYNTDFQKKVNPGLYATRSSSYILEALNSAEFTLANAQQNSKYSFAAYLCYTEPGTDGCGNFNDISCESAYADCGAKYADSAKELSSLCTIKRGGVQKEVQEDCFIVTLRDTADGLSRDDVTPWNDEVQEWFDAHNCTVLMYHLKYRCYANLLKWDAVRANEEYVDLDELFTATFGVTAISSFNGGDPIECSSITVNDRETLMKIAQLHVEAAVLTFASTAVSLTRFGVSSADVRLRHNHVPQLHLLDKLRSVLLLNLFYDGAVQPFREICCAANLAVDYHPMDVLVDKGSAFNTFYPGGLLRLSAKSKEFVDTPNTGNVQASTGLPLTSSDAYIYSVLKNAPMKASWQAATGQQIDDIEAF